MTKEDFTSLILETLDTEFIPNPFSMFHKIYYDDSEGQEPEQDLSRYKDCYVKIIIKNKTNQYMFELRWMVLSRLEWVTFQS